jgi:hypothetical protein
VPFVSPPTVALVGTTVLPTGAVTVAEPPAGVEVTVYEVMALPPLDAGALHETEACALPAVAVTALGAPGAVAGVVGVTLFDGADAGPLPTALTATTVNVYGTPLFKPLTVALVGTTVLPAGAVTVALPPAGDELTTYEVMALPPLDAGAVHETEACELPAVATTLVGAPGAVAPVDGVTLFESADAGPVPMSVVAVTEKLYVLPLTSPLTTAVVAGAATMTAPPGGLETTM